MGEVPPALRESLRQELDALTRGTNAEMLVWVHEYGDAGATLVRQPEEIWTHRYTSVVATDAGGWHIALPLWTKEESPSDLSAEFSIPPDGVPRLVNVHVL